MPGGPTPPLCSGLASSFDHLCLAKRALFWRKRLRKRCGDQPVRDYDHQFCQYNNSIVPLTIVSTEVFLGWEARGIGPRPDSRLSLLRRGGKCTAA
jgi:hypothetical protein